MFNIFLVKMFIRKINRGLMKNFILVGNANTGKTTLLNNLTNSHEHTGNWHGVTVEEKQKQFNIFNQSFSIVDLPGIYSLTAFSLEEQVSINYIFNNKNSIILNTCDINNLQRNLYLTLELLSLNCQVVLLINSMGNKNLPNFSNLEKELNIKIYCFDFDNKNHVRCFKSNLATYLKNKKNIKQKTFYNSFIKKIYSKEFFNLIDYFSLKYKIDYFSIIKIFEQDEFFIKKNNLKKILENVKKEIYLDKNLNNNIIKNNSFKFDKNNKYNFDFYLDKIIEEKYNYIQTLYFNILKFQNFKESNLYLSKNKKNNKNINKKNNLNNLKLSNKHKTTSTAYGEEFLDKIFLNKYFAIPIFFALMLFIFYLTFFSLGAILSDILNYLIKDLFGCWFVNFFSSFCQIEWINGLIQFAIIDGVGSLICFLPQIVLLFLFLAILEDSGYFSRIAFCFDDIFKKIGLSGKSVYTLLMGFGCSASAVLTARNMDSKNAKIKTAILTPYMSCSAKLPIYAVLGGAFFGAGNIFIIFLLYLLGVITALFISVVLEKFGLKTTQTAFILEFPPYRLSKPKRILQLVWLNMKSFLIKITTIFVSMNIIVWCLSSFSFTFSYVPLSNEKSMIQVLGEFLAPIFAPLGFNNWGAVSALLAGIVAKEIVVSSIAIFNGISVATGSSAQQQIKTNNNFENIENNSNNSIITTNNQISQSLNNPQSAVYFTSSSSLSYMTFCLLYCPCIATMSVLSKEIGIKWTMIAIVIQLTVAYFISFLVFNLYNCYESFGLLTTILVILVVFLILISFICVVSFLRQKNKCKYCGLCR